MLLEFSVANFRSFHQKCTFSLLAQGISDDPKSNIIRIHRAKILKTAAIYGANSSGKSNLVKAINAMALTILRSIKLNNEDSLDYDPFLLCEKQDQPTFFEIIFSIEDVKFRYGFEFNANAIENEWLFKSPIHLKSEKPLFIRTREGIAVNEAQFPEGINKEENTNKNRLFLSLCGQLGGSQSNHILSWFDNALNIVSGLDHYGYVGVTERMLHSEDEGHKQAREFFNTLKLGFTSLATTESEIDDTKLPTTFPSDLKNILRKGKTIEIESIHNIYNKKGHIIGEKTFKLKDMESAGTQKLIQLAGPIFNTLVHGKILIVDELDAKMHPLISHYIINLFNDPIKNPKNAQLIFTTHDTHLLTAKLLRRDQIWFTEKDKTEQTDLYNMMDIVLPDGSKPRNDSNYEKNYIAGRYGAIPYIMND